MNDLCGGDSGAVFSDCVKYRYRLWRIWNDALPFAFVGMLNPSTAGEHEDDATNRVLRNFKARLGFGGLYVGNQGAFITPYPTALWRADDPIGPDNDDHLRKMIGQCNTHICAWGARSLVGRDATILKMIQDSGHRAYCFAHNANGSPHHPLRMKQPDVLMEYPSRSVVKSVT